MATRLERQAKAEREAIGDIRTDTRKRAAAFGRSSSGGATLAWYRGRHSGWVECVERLNRRHPLAAKELRDHFGLDEEGNLK